MGKYDDIDFTPPKTVQNNAKRGLELRREFGRGGTEVGIARARTLSNGQAISPETVGRMVSYFARHEVDKREGWSNPSDPSNGYIAWLLWGGDAGRSWAGKLQRQMESRDKSVFTPRHMFLVSSNNRIDRDSEIVAKRALENYVISAHDALGNYTDDNDLLWWHGGEPIGKIIECDVIEGFLVEIAVELPNKLVTVGKTGNEDTLEIATIWDMFQEQPRLFGVSQGFYYPEQSKQDDVYYQIIKHETSVLPMDKASNPFTMIKVLR